jgi:hypothetical protein
MMVGLTGLGLSRKHDLAPCNRKQAIRISVAIKLVILNPWIKVLIPHNIPHTPRRIKNDEYIWRDTGGYEGRNLAFGLR